MDQHPVPRNITGFQFQLIGSMTVKQFGYLLVGLILAFVFFKLPLSFFRFPLAGVCAFVGFAFAFLPIQERPLDIWVVNLIKSIYSPTQFVWQKESILPDVLTHIPTIAHTAQQQTQIAYHHDAKDKLAAYLQTIAPTERELLDERERKILQNVNTRFGEDVVVKPVTIHKSSIFAPKPIATPPGKVGVVAGIIKEGQLPVAGILITIRDQQGKPVRLLRSNQEGKFASSIALPAGQYEAVFEDSQSIHQINPFRFQVGADALVPWLINATRAQHN